MAENVNPCDRKDNDVNEELYSIADRVLEKLNAYGADDAQVSVTKKAKNEINIDAGEFSLFRTTYSTAISMTAICGMKKGAASLNSVDDAELDLKAIECIESARASSRDEALSIAPLIRNAGFKYGVAKPDMDRFFDRVEEYMSDLRADYPKVFIEQLIADFESSENVFANTNGVRFDYDLGYYSLGTMYSAHDGDKVTSFNGTDVDFVDLDRRIIDIGVQRMMYDMCQKELDSEPFEGKFTGTAVFAPSCLGDIILTAIDEFASDGAVIENIGPWRDKLGKQVASPSLSVDLIPLDDRIIGGPRYSGEGYLTENCSCITNGVLDRFVISEYAARKSGEKRSPARSGCVEVKAGDTPYEQLIGNIDRGILVCRLSGGAPASNGDFSAVAKNSFLIENGRITKPVTETMLSGNIADMLKNVTAISRETVCDGTCVFPWVAFDGVTVS